MPPRATATPKSSQNLLRVPVGASSVLTAGRLLRAGATPTGPARYGFEMTSSGAQLFGARSLPRPPNRSATAANRLVTAANRLATAPNCLAAPENGLRQRGASCFGVVQAVLAWRKLFWRGASCFDRPQGHPSTPQGFKCIPQAQNVNIWPEIAYTCSRKPAEQPKTPTFALQMLAKGHQRPTGCIKMQSSDLITAAQTLLWKAARQRWLLPVY